MNWTIREFFFAFSKGYSIDTNGEFYSSGHGKNIGGHEEILNRLTAEAANGNKFSAQALTEAMRRRMMQ